MASVIIFFPTKEIGAMLNFGVMFLKFETVVMLHMLITWLAFLCNILYTGTSNGPTQYLKLFDESFWRENGQIDPAGVQYCEIICHCLFDRFPLISPYGLLFCLQHFFSWKKKCFHLQVQITPKICSTICSYKCSLYKPMKSDVWRKHLFLWFIFSSFFEIRERLTAA